MAAIGLTITTTATSNPDGSCTVAGNVTFPDGSSGTVPTTTVSAHQVSILEGVIPSIINSTLLVNGASGPITIADVARILGATWAFTHIPTPISAPVAVPSLTL